MASVILSTAARYLLPLLLLFSVFVLFRGHDEPGGGFVGGLVAAAAFALYALAFDTTQARRVLRFDPRSIVAGGLLTSASAGAAPLLFGKPFLTALWGPLVLPVVGKVSSPLFFDVGVYLVVIGVVSLIVFSLNEE